MMSIEHERQTAAGSYAPPVCEEIPVWAEGPLCTSNETVGENESEW